MKQLVYLTILPHCDNLFSSIISGTTPVLSHDREVILLLHLIQQSGLQSGWSDCSYQTSHQFNRSAVLVCGQFSSAHDFYEYFSFWYDWILFPWFFVFHFSKTSISQMSSRQLELSSLNWCFVCPDGSVATALTCVSHLIHETRSLPLSNRSAFYSFNLLIATHEEEITSCPCR